MVQLLQRECPLSDALHLKQTERSFALSHSVAMRASFLLLSRYFVESYLKSVMEEMPQLDSRFFKEKSFVSREIATVSFKRAASVGVSLLCIYSRSCWNGGYLQGLGIVRMVFSMDGMAWRI